jgi:hypothetical protein
MQRRDARRSERFEIVSECARVRKLLGSYSFFLSRATRADSALRCNEESAYEERGEEEERREGGVGLAS